MTKKTLLMGRKRISELADSTAVDAKKQELLDLKSQELPSREPTAKPEQAQLPLGPAEPVLETAPAPAKITPQPVAHKPAPIPAAPPKPVKPTVQSVQEEALAVAAQLQQHYFRLEKAGSPNRYQYSMQVRHDLMVQEIKKIIQQKARQYQAQGIKEDVNLVTCQAFTDSLQQALAKFGIKINPLKLKKFGEKRH